MTDPAERTAQNARLFGQVAATYDQLGFLRLAALALADEVQPRPGQRVLDIATGTGEVALALARQSAQVTGLDLAPEMIAAAQAKAQGQAGINFVVGDAAALPFQDGCFDLVVCAAGLFFMPDMAAALREWRRVLRPGGRVVFSSFGRGLLGDLPTLWRGELGAVGLKPAAPPLGRLPTPEAAADLLREASFGSVTVQARALEYTFATPQSRWQEIEGGLEGAVLQELDAPQREAVAQAHLRRLEGLAWPQTVPVPLLVALGVRDSPGQNP